MREHRTSGSVEGAGGDPRSYSDPRIAPAKPALEAVSTFVDFDIKQSAPYRFGMNKAKQGDVSGRKRSRRRHPVDLVFGILNLAKPVDVLIDEMRGRRRNPKLSRRSRSRRS